MLRLYLVLGLGGSKGHVKMAIFAFIKFFSIYGWENSLSIKIPLINYDSLKLFPGFPTILIKSKLTSFLSISATLNTASTAISANCYLHYETTLELKAIFALSINSSREVFGYDSFKVSKCSSTLSLAISNPAEILSGWIPFSKSFNAYSMSIPAKITIPVVPSPISLS